MSWAEGKPPTIYDVAKAAGVAPSTVSRAFSRPGRVRAETAAHVRAVAERLGYRASPTTCAATTPASKMIAAMVADVANPVFAVLVRGVQEEASTNGYVVLLADARESGALEREALERLLPAVDGIVVGGSRMSDTTIRMIAKQKPLVVLNREVRGVPSVVPDNARGGRRLVEHLAELGHESVTYVSGPEASWADGARLRAVREAAHELSIGAHQVGPFPPTVAGGVAAASQLAAHNATAVVAYNDLMAIGAVLGLRDLGYAVPADVSVGAFDNIFVAGLVSPPLTTVAAPLAHMGRTAVRALVAMIGGAGPRAERGFVVPVRLVIRGSTGQRRRKRVSPAFGTTSVSGSASSAARLTSAGSR